MYPLPEGMFAPRNQWYIAAWASEICRDPFERWFLGEPVALYRREDGRAVALEGRCPHRSYPLGKSRVVGDGIQCGYHGITFGPDGRCTSIPSQAVIPSACRVRSYPLVEQWDWVWIWMGDPGNADSALIPTEAELFDGRHVMTSGGHRLLEGRYMLFHDNLFDLTHLGYLHQNSFGGGAGAQNTVPKVEIGPNKVSSLYTQLNVDIPEFHAQVIGYNGKVDRYEGLTCYLPGLHVGGMRLTKPGRANEWVGSSKVYHGITPATKGTTHYFFASGLSWSNDPADSKRQFDFIMDIVIEEDAAAASLIERMLGQLGSEWPCELLIRADNVCVVGRRAFERLISEERASTDEAASASPSASEQAAI